MQYILDQTYSQDSDTLFVLIDVVDRNPDSMQEFYSRHCAGGFLLRKKPGHSETSAPGMEYQVLFSR